MARSRECVGTLARMAELDASLEPQARRLDRLRALGRAVTLEKAGDVLPFSPGDSLEEAVSRWFVADSTLAVRFIAQPDSTIPQERTRARNALLERLRQAAQQVSETGQGMLREGAPVEEEARPCEGALLIRSAVLEACATTSSPVCAAASATDPENSPYPFVDAAEDLWDVEEYRPWSQPVPLQLTPEGGLTGSRTSARARRGNVVFVVSLAPLIQQRSGLSETAIAQLQANLDSLGFTFDHPQFLMAPGFEIQVSLPAPLGGETHYVVHFGDLSGDDLIWSVEAGAGGLVQATQLATAAHLARLRAAEAVSLTALRIPQEEGATAEAVFTVPLLAVGQETNVTSLLQYMSGGGLSQDLRALIPPGAGG